MRCHRITCTLQTIEKPVGEAPLLSVLAPIARGAEGPGPWAHVHCEASRFVSPDCESISMILHVPDDVPTDFATDLVCVESRFAFTFVTSSSDDEDPEDVDVLNWSILLGCSGQQAKVTSLLLIWGLARRPRRRLLSRLSRE